MRFLLLVLYLSLGISSLYAGSGDEEGGSEDMSHETKKALPSKIKAHRTKKQQEEYKKRVLRRQQAKEEKERTEAKAKAKAKAQEAAYQEHQEGLKRQAEKEARVAARALRTPAQEAEFQERLKRRAVKEAASQERFKIWAVKEAAQVTAFQERLKMCAGSERYEETAVELTRISRRGIVSEDLESLSALHQEMATYKHPYDSTRQVWHLSFAHYYASSPDVALKLFKSIKGEDSENSTKYFGVNGENYSSMNFDEEVAAWNVILGDAEESKSWDCYQKISCRLRFLLYLGKQKFNKNLFNSRVDALSHLRARSVKAAHNFGTPPTTIDVLYTSDNNPTYIRGTMTSMLHGALTTSGDIALHIRWMYPAAFDEQFKKILSLVEPIFKGLGAQLDMIPFDDALITEKQRKYAVGEIAGKSSTVNTPAALMYFYAHIMLPKINRVLYVDAGDTLPRGEAFLALSKFPLGDDMAAILPAPVFAKILSCNPLLKTKIDEGFLYGNSGVFPLNLEAMRKAGIDSEKVDAVIPRVRSGLCDGPLFTTILEPKRALPERLNDRAVGICNLSLDRGMPDTVLHMNSSKQKPWRRPKASQDLGGLTQMEDRLLAHLLAQSIHKRYGKKSSVAVANRFLALAFDSTIKSQYRALFEKAPFDRQAWDFKDSAALSRAVCPGEHVTNIGANYGWFTYLLCDLVGRDGEVYSLEPNSEVLPYLEAGVTVNGFDAYCSVLPFAASDKTFSGEMLIPIKNVGGGHLPFASGVREDAEGPSRKVPFQAKVLDEILAKTTKPITTICIDVEGHEFPALKGANSILQHPEMLIMFEWKRVHIINQGYKPDDLLQYLMGMGFKFYAVEKKSTQFYARSPETLRERDFANIFAYRGDINTRKV